MWLGISGIFFTAQAGGRAVPRRRSGTGGSHETTTTGGGLKVSGLGWGPGGSRAFAEVPGPSKWCSMKIHVRQESHVGVV